MFVFTMFAAEDQGVANMSLCCIVSPMDVIERTRNVSPRGRRFQDGFLSNCCHLLCVWGLTILSTLRVRVILWSSLLIIRHTRRPFGKRVVHSERSVKLTGHYAYYRIRLFGTSRRVDFQNKIR